MVQLLKKSFSNIFEKIKNIFTLSKKDVIMNFEVEVGALVDDVLPLLSDLITNVENGTISEKFVESNGPLTKIRQLISKKVNKNLMLLKLFKMSIEDIRDYSVRLQGLMEKTLPPTVTDKTVSLRELGSLSVLNYVSFYRNYLYDLIYAMVCDQAQVDIFQDTYKQLETTAGSCAEAYDKLNKQSLEKILKDLPKLSGTAVRELISAGENVSDNALQGEEFSKARTILSSHFIGNPIYHIGLFIADIQNWCYENNKAKKQTIELILIDLNKKKNGENDPDLEKQIQYYSNLVLELNYKIKKYEDENKRR